MTLNQARSVALLAVLALSQCSCLSSEEDVVDIDVYRERLAALSERDFFQDTIIVDRHGVLLAELAPRGRRIWTSIEDIPLALQQAVIATEDKTFRDNAGVDTSAVARALVQNAQAGDTVSGASTITMQLVRLVAFEPELRYEASLDRKVLEAQLAAEVAEQYTKDEILESYLNVAYYGAGAYGVEAAAREYFSCNARELTLGQSTLLAGLLQAPSHLNPRTNLEGALTRRDTVLGLMVETGYLTDEEVREALSERIAISEPQEMPVRRARHFVDFVLSELPTLVGPRLAARGGFTVTTTLDAALEERLAGIAARHVRALESRHDLTDAAVVVVRPETGEILAMVGGLDYDDPEHGQVNVTVSPRQPGSAFKPITYAAAIEQGMSPASLLWDVPWQFEVGDGTVYEPRNYDDRYRGPVRMREALGNSLNAASVHLLYDVGVAKVHALASEMGLVLDPDPWHYGLTLTLGGAEAPLLDLVGAYAAIAAGGRHADPTSILHVRPLEGGAAAYVLRPQPTRAVAPQTAWLVSDMLSDPDARRPAFAPGGPLETSRVTAVKTGTTNDFRDNVTVGYTEYVAVGVWTGNKDGRPMRDVLGITGAAPIWHDAMEEIFADTALMLELGGGDLPASGFPEPPGITRGPVCDLSTLTTDGRCRTFDEVFADGTYYPERGLIFDSFVLSSARRTAYDANTVCAMQQGTQHPSAQVLLVAPEDPLLADQVREWAQSHGVRVSPAPCSDR